MTAGDLCHRDVVTIRPHDLLVDAAERIRDEHLVALIVVAEPEGDRVPIGILTAQQAADALGRTAHVPHLTVADVMNVELTLVNASDAIDAVRTTMDGYTLCCVPVVDALGGLEGILTREDLELAGT